MDLQPAHRAEALDVLAAIELRFAMLREKVYVEKMEALAWQEALAADSALLFIPYSILHFQYHIQAHIQSCCTFNWIYWKRLELASRKKAYEITNVKKRTKMNEDATWK